MDVAPTYVDETTDVIICGCGPTGALLSAHLGRSQVRNIVLEKEPHITTDPRGIALDEDGIRALQSLGLYDKIYSEIGRSMDWFNFVGGVHHNLRVKPFMRMAYGTTEGGTGHVGFICHKQPVLEANLRAAMDATGLCSLRVRSTLTSISEDEDWVYVDFEDQDGAVRHLRAKYLVGADGKTGYTRKKYLEPRGIHMEQASKFHYREVWVALNWKMTVPTEKTHPDFPLWRLGYTSEEVYDLYFPKEFRFLCNPERPAVCGRFGLPEDRLWRFEFLVKQGEDGMHMATPEMIEKIVVPYITHEGSRYGLSTAVRYPQDCIQVLRSRPFWFSARSCNKWAEGRVLLCGDAAHVFPPFGGQGIASGFRDALALAWRLDVACRPGFKNHQALFAGWYTERKQQLERSLAATVENGRYVTESNWWKILIRNTHLWILQLIPSWRRWFEMGQRREGMVRYDYKPGMAFLPQYAGGMCLPQVYCVPISCNGIEEEVHSVQFTDDVIFANHKKGLFQLVVVLDSNDEMEAAQSAVKGVDQLSNGLLFQEETTYLVNTLSSRPVSAMAMKTPQSHVKEIGGSPTIARLASADVFAQSRLCTNRPVPHYFDEKRLSREVNGRQFVIVRQDRFIFAACIDRSELHDAVQQLSKVLNGDEGR